MSHEMLERSLIQNIRVDLPVVDVAECDERGDCGSLVVRFERQILEKGEEKSGGFLVELRKGLPAHGRRLGSLECIVETELVRDFPGLCLNSAELPADSGVEIENVLAVQVRDVAVLSP